jgi:hypothetical protein
VRVSQQALVVSALDATLARQADIHGRPAAVFEVILDALQYQHCLHRFTVLTTAAECNCDVLCLQ